MELVLSRFMNTTWEWDAAVRGQQALELATKGWNWYFFEGNGHYVWLPLWQFLLAALFSISKLNPLFWGETISALSSGVITVYVISFVTKISGKKENIWLAGPLLLTSGYYVAYGSQAMTDLFSAALLIVSLFHTMEYVRDRRLRDLTISSLALLLNSMTRYEGWFFALILGAYLMWKNDRRQKSEILRGFTRFAMLLLPTAIWVLVWLLYNQTMSGTLFGFENWIFENNGHETWSYFLSWPPTFLLLLRDLFLGTGSFWLFLIRPIFAKSNARNRPDELRFFAILALLYSVYFVYSAFTGYNSGWVRHFLYVYPLSVVAISQRKLGGREWLAVMISIGLGLFSFGENVSLHDAYVQRGLWPGSNP